MLEIDGSQGEGGGQVVRTTLAIAAVTGQSVRITNIRAGREKPGLRRQHLAAVRAAGEIARADVDGVKLGSREITFQPRGVAAGEYRVDVAGAGSTTLVLQTILPALATADGPSKILLEGGTHNPFAPPFEFLDKVYLPLVERMGPKVKRKLDRPGFYPTGEGKMRVEITPAKKLQAFDLLERGEIVKKRARATSNELPQHVVERELKVVKLALQWPSSEMKVGDATGARGPGNVVQVEIECEHATEVVTAFGAKGIRAEHVAQAAADEAKAYLASGAPVGAHLADQLLVPLALAGGGRYRAVAPLPPHAETQIARIGTRLGVKTKVVPVGDRVVQVEVGGK